MFPQNMNVVIRQKYGRRRFTVATTPSQPTHVHLVTIFRMEVTLETLPAIAFLSSGKRYRPVY